MQAFNLVFTSAVDMTKQEPQRKKLDEIFEMFMRERRHCKPATIRAYTETWRYMIDFGTKAVHEVSTHEIAAFRSDLAQCYSPRTVNRIVGLLRSVMAFAVERGLAEETPARFARSVREEILEIDPFTVDELELVFRSVKMVYRYYFQVSFWTGARPSELQALRWKDIDLESKEMLIYRARVRGIEGTTKTKRSRRRIPLNPPAIEALVEQFKLTGSDPHNYVFLNANGRPITKHMDAFWKKACVRAGVRCRPPYQLRHSFASFMLAAGETPGYVAMLLGHTTTEMLYRHYARWIPNANGVDGQKSLEHIKKLRGETK